jgi:hypothetical protein
MAVSERTEKPWQPSGGKVIAAPGLFDEFRRPSSWRRSSDRKTKIYLEFD